ncbi:MAG: RNA polymerase subunit sigma-70 [Acidobacteriaceae bacterium]|nr:RNA polymerase subunit sigma-70 [Acidobacteriaceae bacterium]
MPNQTPDREIERVARGSYGKLIALLTAEFRDLPAAEDALSDALLKALARWQQDGVPESPEGWLITTARRRLLDEARRKQSRASPEVLNRLTNNCSIEAFSIPDRRLALFFACAHPAIDSTARAPLILQAVLGLQASQIAEAFLLSETAMAQRLVRAKRKIRAAGIPFQIPASTELTGRLQAVLEAIYACYTAGWSTPPGADDESRGLAQEAIWLARILVDLCPDEPEAVGLLALILHVEARSAARYTPEGDYIPLSEQDPAYWDRGQVKEAESLLRKAASFGKFGRFQLEAAIQSAYAARLDSGVIDWPSILLLYDALRTVAESPVIRINRAIVIAEAHGAPAGLRELDQLIDREQAFEYQPYWAARAYLLRQIEEREAAQGAYKRAIALSRNDAVRRFLQKQMEEIAFSSTTPHISKKLMPRNSI